VTTVLILVFISLALVSMYGMCYDYEGAVPAQVALMFIAMIVGAIAGIQYIV
jgi:hypothetical protein